MFSYYFNCNSKRLGIFLTGFSQDLDKVPPIPWPSFRYHRSGIFIL